MVSELDKMLPYWHKGNEKRMKIWLNYSRKKKYDVEAKYILPIIPKGIHKVLDVPCGSGFYYEYLDFDEYVGLDQSPLFIDYCKSKFSGDFMVGDCRKLSFEDDVFDCVFCIGLVCHGDRKDAMGVMKEITRVSSRYVVLEHLEDKKDRISVSHKKKNIHEQVFKEGWVQGIMRDLGFKPIKSVKLEYLSVSDLKGTKRIVVVYERI